MLLNLSFFRRIKTPLIYAILSCIVYFFFAYYTERTDTVKLLSLYTLGFVLAYFLKKSAGFNFRFLVITSVVLRFIFLLAIPNLSQDFYRFIWDGRMIFEGFNPYLYAPESFISQNDFPVNNAQELYEGMGKLNASHFTNYPPINQLVFFVTALISNYSILGSVVVMRILIILADLGIIFFGKKLLESFKLPSSRIWWYALNPFIIIELTGNLHFESVMLFFLLWSLYLLQNRKWKLSAVILALSISVKLIPLMFLPLYFWWFSNKQTHPNKIENFNWLKKLILFYSITLGCLAILFLPFFSLEFINNYNQTLGLWFTNFEFNASVYYLAREIGYIITGYNEIAIIGKVLPIISIGVILYFSFFKGTSKN